MNIIIAGENRSCEIRPDETVLAALARSGIALSAPCGGRGICGKCRLTLIEGSIESLTGGKGKIRPENPRAGPKPGEFFSACQSAALSDLTLALPEEELRKETGKGQTVRSRLQKGRIRRAGAGVDIGTTTVSAELVDLDTGESLETVSELNAQRNFGADVMSRINAARNGKTEELFSAINGQIASMLRNFIQTWELTGIQRCHVSGNTAMLHLFTGTNPSGMGEAPFTPVFLEERNFTGNELSLGAERITVLPGISAFVGADIVSGLACVDILNAEDHTFLVDIGTNGEMALLCRDRNTNGRRQRTLLCCSTAAGPCFEGAEISCGMGAQSGAIDRIALRAENPPFRGCTSGPLAYTTLGNAKAQGICGTGLVDAIAVMKKLSAIDETGALPDTYAKTGFPLAEGIAVSQKDIRQFQLAKSAIRTGITLLCKWGGLKSPGDLGMMYISGGLGFFINLESAVTAGLLPPKCAKKQDGKNRTAVCGNTSLKGTVQSLCDPDFLQRCRDIIACSTVVELASDPDFAETFADNMYF
jgi:uncharacterized 2Fe-2S/4Fe-4S cluster protein (DUF4445 family)